MHFFRRKKYHHLNKVVINSNALVQNITNIQKYNPKQEVSAVVKSNAYGHGIKQVAQILDKLKLPFLIVDSLYEAYELYKLKLKTPILILGYTNPENFSIKKLPFHFVVYDLNTAKALNKYQKNCNIHIFIDTGMHREGVLVNTLPYFLKNIKKLDNLNVSGICSHFADADRVNGLNSINDQLHEFKKAIKLFDDFGINLKWKHISASAGSLKVTDSDINMVRIGKAMYGIDPYTEDDKYYNRVKLTPILSFISTVVQIKDIKKGEKIGYNFTYTAKKNIKIALIPAGYYDGVDRRLSNRGFVQINGKYCPIVGRVSMNMTVADVTTLTNIRVGDKVVIYSDKTDDKNSLYNISNKLGTIPHEIMVHISETVRRDVV